MAAAATATLNSLMNDTIPVQKCPTSACFSRKIEIATGFALAMTLNDAGVYASILYF
jgi:hypothetical protein